MASRAAARARRVPSARSVGRAVPLALEGERRVRPAVAGHRPGDVVVGQHPRRRRTDPVVHLEGPRRSTPRSAAASHGRGHEVEVERRVQDAGAQVAREPLGVRQPQLADQHPVRAVGLRDPPPAPVDVLQVVAVDVRVPAGRRVGRDLGQRRRPWPPGRRSRCGCRPRRGRTRTAGCPRARGATSGWPQFRSGWPGANRCRYHCSGVPSGPIDARPGRSAELRLPAVGRQRRRRVPRPSRNQNRSRSGEPGPAASAAWNQACWSETWLGTTSMIVRMPQRQRLGDQLLGLGQVAERGSMAR